ncbi:hypothetical protein D3C71_78030 [compost metagenome]
MPTPNVIRYPLDPTGTNPDNLVVDEPHTLPARQIRAVATEYGAFYTESMVVVDAATNQPLVKGVQYYAAELYEVPSGMFGKEVCAIILIKDPSVSPNIRIRYQAVGGEYSRSVTAIIQQIEALNLDDRPVEWGSIINKPSEYPPSHHLHDLGDIYGFEYMVHALDRIRDAILRGDDISHDTIYQYIDSRDNYIIGLIQGQSDALAAHIADQNNPHQVTKAQVLLGLVENFPVASDAEAQAGTATNRYMTPYATKLAIQQLIPDATDVIKGKVQLNLGSSAGDDVNNTDALTASGINYLLTASADNAVKNAVVTLLTQKQYLTKTQGDTYYHPKLAFTPVQQGTGVGQNPANLVKIGWTAGGRLNATVDNTDLGSLATDTTGDGRWVKRAGDTGIGQIQSGSQPMAMTSGNGSNGAYIFRSAGTGDANMAGMTLWNDSYAIRFGVRNDGYVGLGGFSRTPWSWYSDSAGNMVAAGNVIAYSDPLLKENQEPIVDALGSLKKLSGQWFTWRHGIPHIACKAGDRDMGVMADEVEAVFPEIVKKSIPIDGIQYRAVAYEKLVPVLIEAVKELAGRLEFLEGRQPARIGA